MKWGFLIHSLVLLFPDRLYQNKGPSTVPASVLPFLSSLACSFLSSLCLPPSFPLHLLLPSSASFLLPRYYGLSISQYLAHTPLAPCNFLLKLIISRSFFFRNPRTPLHPLRLAHSVLESRVSAMREIKFLLLPQWFCQVLLDTEPVLISQLKTL